MFIEEEFLQVVAGDILKFLEVNRTYSPLLLHGFSVGAYIWGEVLVKIAQDQERYKEIVERTAGQIWDSAADITEIPVGFPKAVFPKNPVLEKTLRQYVLYVILNRIGYIIITMCFSGII